MAYIDMSDFPSDVYASAQKFESYAAQHPMPRGSDAWLDLASQIGIPQNHLEMILARIWAKDVRTIRRLYKKRRH